METWRWEEDRSFPSTKLFCERVTNFLPITTGEFVQDISQYLFVVIIIGFAHRINSQNCTFLTHYFGPSSDVRKNVSVKCSHKCMKTHKNNSAYINSKEIATNSSQCVGCKVTNYSFFSEFVPTFSLKKKTSCQSTW